MTNPNPPIQIDPAHMANHTTRVREMLGDLTQVLEAATYISQCRDGFGSIPRPLSDIAFDALYAVTLDVFRSMGDEAADIPPRLAQTTAEYQDRDGSIGHNLQGLQAQINESGGE